MSSLSDLPVELETSSGEKRSYRPSELRRSKRRRRRRRKQFLTPEIVAESEYDAEDDLNEVIPESDYDAEDDIEDVVEAPQRVGGRDPKPLRLVQRKESKYVSSSSGSGSSSDPDKTLTPQQRVRIRRNFERAMLLRERGHARKLHLDTAKSRIDLENKLYDLRKKGETISKQDRDLLNFYKRKEREFLREAQAAQRQVDAFDSRNLTSLAKQLLNLRL